MLLVEIMPPKISRDVKLDALDLIAKGKKQAEVVASLGCSDSTIRRARRNLHEHGDVERKPQKAGPKSKITLEMENVSCCLCAPC